MKREADGDMGSPQKRTRRGDEEVRLLIPSKVAGSIIGKGGSNITKLRSQYKASITVPDCPGPERILTLSSDLDTICNIINDVVPNLEEHSSNSKELDLRMLIHRSQAGCVIGKSGQKIKEIREQTGARVKIFSNAAPQSTDRIIQIQGHPDQCIDTVREVITLIKGSPIKGAVNNYDPHNYDDFYADEYGGWGGNQNSGNDRRGGGSGGGGSFSSGGRGGGRSNDMRSGGPSGPSRMPTNRGPPPPRGGRFNERSSSGGRDNFSGRGRQSMNGSGSFRSSEVWESPLNSPMNRPPPGGGMLGGSPIHNGLGSSIGGGKNSTQVTIPKDLAGAIIGKGGGRIRKIRQDSGAGITIDEPLPGSNDRIITITGSPNEIQMAQYLLQQSVHNNAQERGNY